MESRIWNRLAATMTLALTLSTAAYADEYSDLLATGITLTPLGGGLYDVEVEVAVVLSSYVPSQPVVVRLYYGGAPIDETMFGPAQPPAPPPATAVCCFNTAGCPDATGYTKSCEGTCPTPNLGAPKVCRYKKPVLFPSKYLPSGGYPPAPGSIPNRLMAVVDPDSWNYEVDDPARTNNSIGTDVPWDEACDIAIESVTLRPSGSPGQFHVDVEAAIAPGAMPPSMPLHSSVHVNGVFAGYATILTNGLPGGTCCYGAIQCTPVSGYTAACGGTCEGGAPGEGVCTYSQIGSVPWVPIQPGDYVTVELDPDGLFAESCAPGASNNTLTVLLPRDPVAYCTGKVNSAGCVPAVTFIGTPSATSLDPFVIGASGVLPGKSGLMFYGHAQYAHPFLGGTLCAQPPLLRTPLQVSSGDPMLADCSGQFAYDFNARIRSGVDATLVSGADVAAQYWYRDAADPSGFFIGLSDALWFQIGD